MSDAELQSDESARVRSATRLGSARDPITNPHPLPAPSLTTDRLRLRLPRVEDAPFFFRLTNDPDWLRFIGDRGVHSEPDAVAYIEGRLLASFRDNGFGLFVVESLATGEPMGISGLVKRPSLEHPDLGFAFLPAYRGRGYAVEAGARAIDDARTRLRLGTILAITSLDNHASIHVLRRLGLVETGTVAGADGSDTLRLFAWTASTTE